MRSRRRWLLAGLAAGVGIGMLRIALGRHYPSDVIFSGVFVLLTAAILYRLMIREAIRPNPTSPTQPIDR